MLTADVRVEEFDASDWLALGELFSPPNNAEEASGGLVIVLSGGKVAAALSTRKGRIDPGHRHHARQCPIPERAIGLRELHAHHATSFTEMSSFGLASSARTAPGVAATWVSSSMRLANAKLSEENRETSA